MKYIDERRLRLGYFVLFGLAIALMIGAMLDFAYHGQRFMQWYVAGLAGLFLVAVLYYGSTEMILKEALDLRPRSVTGAKTWTPITDPTPHEGLSRRIMNAAMETMPSAQPRAVSAGPVATAPTASVSLPGPSARPTVAASPLGPVKVEMNQALMETALQPQMIPKPERVAASPKAIVETHLAFEVGNPDFRVAKGYRAPPGKYVAMGPSRILCMGCGLYFEVVVEKARPLSVPCPRCANELGLSGATEVAAHVKMRCRHCGEFLNLPKVKGFKAAQCVTCGQTND